MKFFSELQKTTTHLSKQRQPHEFDSPILRIDELAVRYDTTFVIDQVSFEVNIGERLAVVGPNGAGKSTLLKVIAGVLNPSKGKVSVFGHEPGGHICIAYISQRSQIDLNFPVTVKDVVMMGRVGKLGLFRNPNPRDWEIVQDSIEIVRLDTLKNRQISQLSGGQQQRMFIARALAQEAELMLLDEPFTGLDVNTQEDVLNILDTLKEKGVTVLVSLHDLNLAAQRFDRVMLINNKMIGIGSPEDVFVPENLLNAYGGHLHLVTTEEGILALGDTCCDEQ